MKPRCKVALRGAQRGMALITSLLFMVAALILGVSVMSTNVMQERMLGNARDQDLAMQAAEAALRDAEQEIAAGFVDATLLFTDACANGLCTPPSQRTPRSPLPVHLQPGFTWVGKRAYGANTGVDPFPMVSGQPVYVIEFLGFLPPRPGRSLTAGSPPAFRITARATGARASTVVILQTIFG